MGALPYNFDCLNDGTCKWTENSFLNPKEYGNAKTSVFHLIFSNTLLIHQVKTTKVIKAETHYATNRCNESPRVTRKSLLLRQNFVGDICHTLLRQVAATKSTNEGASVIRKACNPNLDSDQWIAFLRVCATLIRGKPKAEVENFVLPLGTIGMRKMCHSRQFVVTTEEKNLFSKNDKNAKNESISTVCHIRSRLLSHGRLQKIRFADAVL